MNDYCNEQDAYKLMMQFITLVEKLKKEMKNLEQKQVYSFINKIVMI
jgi:hypothetical protein